MPPGCAIVCLVLGIAGVLLFVVGFALPFWFVDQLRAGTTANHGLWQATECEGCEIKGIEFGVSAEFEAARVFACATVAMGLVSFCFTVVFVNRPNRVWSIRCGAVWGCTALFNLLAVSLFGATESNTLTELNLGVSTSDIGARLGWGFWVAIASLLLFVLLAVNCAFLSCMRKAFEGDDSKQGSPRASRKRLSPFKDRKMQTDHLTKLYVEATKPQRTAGLYPDIRYHQGRSYPESTLTTKTGDVFPPASTYQSNGASVYTVNKSNTGYTIQPTSAAVNIDNRTPQLSALGTYTYKPSEIPSTYHGGSTMGDNQRVILNRPDLTTYANTGSGEPVMLSLPRNGQTSQDNAFNFNPGPNVVQQPYLQQANNTHGFVVAGQPSGYYPQHDGRNIVSGFTTASSNVPYGVY